MAIHYIRTNRPIQKHRKHLLIITKTTHKNKPQLSISIKSLNIHHQNQTKPTSIRPLAAATCKAESFPWPLLSSKTLGSASTISSTNSSSPFSTAPNRPPLLSRASPQLSPWPISRLVAPLESRVPHAPPLPVSIGGNGNTQSEKVARSSSSNGWAA